MPKSANTNSWFAERRGRLYIEEVWTALAGLVLIVSVAVARASGSAGPGCSFYAATGVPCPTCGMTRGLLATAGGAIAQSFAFHPFAPVLAVLAVGAVARWMRGYLRNEAVTAWPFGRRATRALALTYLGFGTLRATLAFAG